MSASHPAQGREGGSVESPHQFGGGARTLAKSLLVGSALAIALVGCTNDSGLTVQTPSSATTQRTSSPTPGTEQQAILEQYRTFWSSLSPVSRMPAAQRRGALSPFTMDPELKSMLAGMSKLDRQGRVLYGENKPRPRVTLAPDSASAVVDDCQDSTAAGSADRRTGAHLTVGVARNHVVVTMKRQAEAWKVYFVSYSKTPC